jgi:hypothetical protein
MRKASLRKIQSVRFDRAESPDHINEGKGWRERDAKGWLQNYGLDPGALTIDVGYIRAKQYPVGGRVECSEIETGVMVTQCEPAN